MINVRVPRKMEMPSQGPEEQHPKEGAHSLWVLQSLTDGWTVGGLEGIDGGYVDE